MTNITELLREEEKRYLQIRRIRKGEILFHEEERCEQIGIILEGHISIVSYLDDGNEVIYNDLSDGDLFGNNLIFSSEPFYKGDIIAIADSTIALICRNDLISLISSNEAFMIAYLEVQSDFTKELSNKIRLLSIASAEERFLFYLHTQKNVCSFRSISDLARHLYLKRETLSRLISRLSAEKRIIRHDKTIRLL